MNYFYAAAAILFVACMIGIAFAIRSLEDSMNATLTKILDAVGAPSIRRDRHDAPVVAHDK